MAEALADLLEARSTDEVTRRFCTRHSSILNSTCHIAMTLTLWIETVVVRLYSICCIIDTVEKKVFQSCDKAEN